MREVFSIVLFRLILSLDTIRCFMCVLSFFSKKIQNFKIVHCSPELSSIFRQSFASNDHELWAKYLRFKRNISDISMT